MPRNFRKADEFGLQAGGSKGGLAMMLDKICLSGTTGLAVVIVSAALFGATSIAVASTVVATTSSSAPLSFAMTAVQPAAVGRSDGNDSQHTRGTNLRVGDLVRFITGGPLMTVRAIQGNKAVCNWMNWKGEMQRGRYPIAELIAIGGPGHRLQVFSS